MRGFFDFVEIDPPGTICQTAAILDVVRECGAKTFVEIGCGAGGLCERLLAGGLTGVGVDSSREALAQARARMQTGLERGSVRLLEGDIMDDAFAAPGTFDVALAIMVMEHIEDDREFLSRMSRLVRKGGLVILGVPGRMDRWNIEDETVGHVRRYERADLEERLRSAGLRCPAVWSLSVPVANLCFHLGNVLIRRAGEERKKSISMREQTGLSGIRSIPFKTVFPRCFRLLLNPATLAPLVWVQRMFYRSNLGLTLLGFGQVH